MESGERFNGGGQKKNGRSYFLDKMPELADQGDKNTDDKFGDCRFFCQLTPIFTLVLRIFAVIQKLLL